MKWWKSKTLIGAILGAASLVVPNPKSVEVWSQAAAIIISAVGVRQAIAKNGQGN